MRKKRLLVGFLFILLFVGFTYLVKTVDVNKVGEQNVVVGIALAFVFKPTAVIWVLIIIGGVLASIIQHFFIARKIPVFTLPFIVITWVFIFVLHHMSHVDFMEMSSMEPVHHDYDDYLVGTNSFGEVIFQGGALSGVIFFIAVFINSPISALYGFIGAIIASVISQIHGESASDIKLGLFGFNAVLSAIAFAGIKKIDGLWVLIAVVLTVYIDDFLIDNHLLEIVGGVFTFPFVLGTCLTLILKNVIFKKFSS